MNLLTGKFQIGSICASNPHLLLCILLGSLATPTHAAVTVSATHILIPDNNPIGISSSIVFPSYPLVDVGGGVTITVNISNSSTLGLRVMLQDPNSIWYTLYQSGQSGTSLVVTYDADSVLPSGDLSGWIGQNPEGIWRLQVIDTLYYNNGWDGEIATWSVTASPVPEMSSTVIAAFGFCLLGLTRSRPYKGRNPH